MALKACLLCVFAFSTLAGCAGHGHVQYRGQVSSASRTGHTFGEEGRVEGGPLPGAHIDLTVTYSKEWSCVDREHPVKVAVETTASSTGWYEVEATFGSLMFSPDNIVVMCVSFPGHDLYEYRVLYESADPSLVDGSRTVNVYLRPKDGH